MKSAIRRLALFTGEPAFEQTLHVGRPNVGDRKQLMTRLEDALDRRWLTNRGPLLQEFEDRLQEFLGVKHVIAVCNATVGLEIAIRAADLNGEVIVPAFTFVATAHALQWQEISPVFCDVDRSSHNIDPASVEALITPRTTGIIGVHLWGRPCEIEALQHIADRHGLTLMFDAAHAFSSRYQGRHVGGFGLAEIFSFHATKVINAFEGGAVATNDDELAHRVRLMNNFGFTGLDSVDYIGTNGKMCEASAGMGLTSLESLDQFVAINRRNHAAYSLALEGLPGLRLVHYPEDQSNSHHYVIVEVDSNTAPLNRDELLAVLHAENVRARRYFYPGCHRMEPYRSMDRPMKELPVTEELAKSVLCLPTGSAVELQDIQRIGEILQLAMQLATDVRSHLGYQRD